MRISDWSSDVCSSDLGRAEVESDAVLLVDPADETADFASHDALHGNGVGRDDMDLELPRAERCRDFEPDEDCADDDGALRRLRLPDYGEAIGERVPEAAVRQLVARQVEPHRPGGGCAERG